VQVTTDHPQEPLGRGVAAQHIAIGVYQDIRARRQVRRRQHIRRGRVGQRAERNVGQGACLGGQRQITATGAGADQQVISRGVNRQRGGRTDIAQLCATGGDVNGLAVTVQLIDRERPRDIQQYVTSGTLPATQLGTAHIEMNLSIYQGAIAAPVAETGDRQAVADGQLAVVQTGTGGAGVLQRGTATHVRPEQVQRTGDLQPEAVDQVQLADVRGTADIEQGACGAQLVQAQVTADNCTDIAVDPRGIYLRLPCGQ